MKFYAFNNPSLSPPVLSPANIMDPSGTSEGSVIPVAVFKKRTAKGKSNVRKRAVTPPQGSDSDSSTYTSSEDESGRKVKRRKTNTGVVTASSQNANTLVGADLTSTKYTADRSTVIKSSNDATKQSNWYDENTTDALSVKNLLGSTRAPPTGPDGTYKGLANATKFVQKNPDAPNRSIGPVKAPTNLRTITVTDFAPDVCKDYKQTGFCGFGDSCKYLHAREDYKQGWQLDKEWENVTKGKRPPGGTKIASMNRNPEDAVDSEEEDAILEGIPFACIICKENYKDPIVTKCGHYFCEGCALKRYRKDPSCAACGAGTGGVFNVAKGLKKILDRKKARRAKKREKAVDAGEDVSSDEEE